MALMKLCKCGSRVPINKARCDKCEKEYNNRDKINKRKKNKETAVKKKDEYDLFYGTRAWKRVKDTVKTRDKGLCLLCLIDNRYTFQECVHHIVPIKEDKTLSLNPDNLLCLCLTHHTQVHKEYLTRRKGDMIIKLQELVELSKGRGI